MYIYIFGQQNAGSYQGKEKQKAGVDEQKVFTFQEYMEHLEASTYMKFHQF